MSDLELHTPFTDALISHTELSIRPVANMGKIMMQRSNCVTDKAMITLGVACDINIPLIPCEKTYQSENATDTACIEPNMWMVTCERERAESLAANIEKARGNDTITAAVVTDQYLCLNIRGAQARALLAKGCALNLSEDSFSENQVARTLLAQANIIIWQTEKNGFNILFDVSLSDYLWCWLDGASKEFLTIEGT